MNRSLSSPNRTGNGFTLIEVIVTLSVFILLTASVFGIMSAVFESSNELQANQNRRDQISALHAYVKNCFDSLGATGGFMTYRRGDGEGLSVNGVIFMSPDGLRALDAQHQDDGLYTLRLARPGHGNPSLADFDEELDKDHDALTWIPLIREVRSIDWKFRQSATSDWLSESPRVASKPMLIQFTIEVAGDERSSSMIFQIPNLVAPTLGNTQPVAFHAP